MAGCNGNVFVRGFVAFDWASMWHEYGILGLVARAISTNGPKTLILKYLISDLFSAMNFSDRAIGLGRLFRSISIPWFSGVLSILLIQRIKG